MKTGFVLIRLTSILLVVSVVLSCSKVDVKFEDDVINNGPGVSYLENIKVDIGTYKTDSFKTSGANIFMIGTHNDPSFGKLNADTYAEVQLPQNTVKDKNVVFDSICIRLMPTGYLGDTLQPFRMHISQITQLIENASGIDAYYNTRSFEHANVPLATFNGIIMPGSHKAISIRLPDALGLSWLTSLQQDDYNIQSQERFRNYFKGLVFLTDSLYNNNLFHFAADTSGTFISVYYKERGLINISRKLDFTFNSSKQFVNISNNYTGTPLAGLNPVKKSFMISDSTNHKTFFNSTNQLYTKFSFPDILRIKELYPNSKVTKAVLEITPAIESYRYPYHLPAALQLNVVNNDDNSIFSYIYDATTGSVQNGNLVYDPLNPVNTKYSFDVTSFINDLLTGGQFSNKALLLNSAFASNIEKDERLILNDQSVSNGVKLKMYVLGF
jgi:hypothetical protein